MHPGPINRGVEMSSYVVDGGQSHILKQVENGVAVRMAMLYHVCGGELSSGTSAIGVSFVLVRRSAATPPRNLTP